MANWISIKQAAEKFGTTEDKIHRLIRLRYITFSFVDDSKLGGNHDEKLLMVNADELNNNLDMNVVVALNQETEDMSVVRIPLVELDDLLWINDNFSALNNDLVTKIKTQRRIILCLVILLLIVSATLLCIISMHICTTIRSHG